MTNVSDIRKVPRLYAGESRPYSVRRPGIETVEPTTEGTATTAIDVFSDLNHTDMVTL